MIKLINERTKEIVVFGDGIIDLSKIGCKNVAEMIEAGWKDYKEPKEPKDHWFIQSNGIVKISQNLFGDTDYFEDMANEIGNLFETKEEAEKAVEKLKAWKRLKDKGLRFRHWKEAPLRHHSSCIAITGNMDCDEEARDDLDICFGGEE